MAMVRRPAELKMSPAAPCRGVSGLARPGGRIWFVAAWVLLLALSLATPGLAREKNQVREVLALYDGRDDPELAYIELHRVVQTVLEYQGLKVSYLDMSRDPLPGAEAMSRYRGSVAHLKYDDLANAEAFLNWVRREVKSGRKVVLLGHLGPQRDSRESKPVDAALLDAYNADLGFEANKFYSETPALLAYGAGQKQAVNFERRLPAFPPLHPGFNAPANHIEALVSVRRKNNPKSECPVVCVTPWGGVAWNPYYLYRKDGSGFTQWYIDPFYFFSRAFETRDIPKPDVSLLSGRRLWYNHIDGDALLSLSHIKKGATCGAVVRDQLLKQYDLPFTVSVITCEVDPQALGSPEVVKLARSIFELPNVEPASHTFSHPFDWEGAVASVRAAKVKVDKKKAALRPLHKGAGV